MCSWKEQLEKREVGKFKVGYEIGKIEVEFFNLARFQLKQKLCNFRLSNLKLFNFFFFPTTISNYTYRIYTHKFIPQDFRCHELSDHHNPSQASTDFALLILLWSMSLHPQSHFDYPKDYQIGQFEQNKVRRLKVTI